MRSFQAVKPGRPAFFLLYHIADRFSRGIFAVFRGVKAKQARPCGRACFGAADRLLEGRNVFSSFGTDKTGSFFSATAGKRATGTFPNPPFDSGALKQNKHAHAGVLVLVPPTGCLKAEMSS
ncbi:MAG: hypothetical protein IJU16_06245, partial [Clostridia bacterium]|nr:hypothetical protein [Clostridia bacterium]